jgi:hypothetical protein
LIDSILNQKQDTLNETFQLISREHQMSKFHVIKIYASLMKLFQIGLRHSSMKHEVFQIKIFFQIIQMELFLLNFIM